MIGKTVYPITPSLVEWLSENFLPVEKSTFEYWRRALPLVRVVNDTVHSHTPKYIALSAIEQHNELNNESLTYEEILGVSSDFIFSDFGEWTCFIEDQQVLLCGQHDNCFDAFDFTENVDWLLVWWPLQDSLIVHRSPYIRQRNILVPEGMSEGGNGAPICDGLDFKGDPNHRESMLESFVLPPDVEGSIRQDQRENHHGQHRSSLPADVGEGRE